MCIDVKNVQVRIEKVRGKSIIFWCQVLRALVVESTATPLTIARLKLEEGTVLPVFKSRSVVYPLRWQCSSMFERITELMGICYHSEEGTFPSPIFSSPFLSAFLCPFPSLCSSFPTLPISISILSCPVLTCAVVYCTVLSCLVLYCTVLSCTVLYCTALYCTVLLYCTLLYWTVLSCTVLYCTALSCTVVSRPILSCPILSSHTWYLFTFQDFPTYLIYIRYGRIMELKGMKMKGPLHPYSTAHCLIIA